MGNKQYLSGRISKLRKKKYISAPIPYLQRQYGIEDWKVKGLWFGASGTVSKLICDFVKTNILSKVDLRIICLEK